MAAADRCRVNDGGDATDGSAALVLPLPLADDLPLPLALALPEADCDCVVVDAVWCAPRNRSAKHANTSVWTNGVRSLKRRSSALHSWRMQRMGEWGRMKCVRERASDLSATEASLDQKARQKCEESHGEPQFCDNTTAIALFLLLFCSFYFIFRVNAACLIFDAYRFKVFLQRLGFRGDDDCGDHFDCGAANLPRRVVVVGRVAIVAERERAHAEKRQQNIE